MDEWGLAFGGADSTLPAALGRKSRDRSREGAIKGDASWKKHQLIETAVSGQARKLSIAASRFRKAPGVIVDMHAGDGSGVPDIQPDFWRESMSHSTAELAVMLGASLHADVLLCERDGERRKLLQDDPRFRDAWILDDHRHAAAALGDRYSWALILNDPTGCSDHGVEHMQAIGQRISMADFVIVFNQAGWRRVNGYAAKNGGKMAEYQWMSDWPEWGRRLSRRQIAVSGITSQSQNFQHRVLIAANSFADCIVRNRFFEVHACS